MANDSETRLYAFRGYGDGLNPLAGVIADKSGALYGTTFDAGAHAWGVVYRLAPAGSGYTESVLYSFSGGNDGAGPRGELAFDARGNLYGTTRFGGVTAKGCTRERCGVAFELQRSGSGYKERVIYRFKGGNDGFWPFAGLWAGSKGAWYGTTVNGGSHNCGVVYKLAPSHARFVESVIYTFTGLNDCGPVGPVVGDRSGALYGTAWGAGGNYFGLVFKLTPGSGGFRETVLHTFHKGDGWRPSGALVMDRTGALYGTTAYGGNNCHAVYWRGCGNVFRLSANKSGQYTETDLYDFQGVLQGQLSGDGAFPMAGLVMDKHGFLYGTTWGGGLNNCSGGCGTVFEVASAAGGAVIRYRFGGPAQGDGASPMAPVLLRSGNLFGTTNMGGPLNVQGGIVFEVSTTVRK